MIKLRVGSAASFMNAVVLVSCPINHALKARFHGTLFRHLSSQRETTLFSQAQGFSTIWHFIPMLRLFSYVPTVVACLTSRYWQQLPSQRYVLSLNMLEADNYGDGYKILSVFRIRCEFSCSFFLAEL